MAKDEILLCVCDDIGIRTWLERNLQGAWPIEFVGASDLSRINRIVAATGTRLVMVHAEENDPEKATRIISALSKSDEELVLVSVVRRLAQDFLLQSMRAGARDCFVARSDGQTLRTRISDFLYSRPTVGRHSGRTKQGKITLVTGATPVVDTRFFAQNMTFAANFYHPDERILALDTASDERHSFYLDSKNRLTLESLLRNPDSLDASLIEMGLEEYSPNLRFLSGWLPPESIGEERNADLFIVMSQLMSLFDRIIVNVNPTVADFWINAMGLHASDLVMLIHPVVEQAHNARLCLDSWQTSLRTECRRSLIIDGVERSHGLPSLSDIERAVGIDAAESLPMDWGERLKSINAGLPMHRVSSRSRYQKELMKIMKRFDSDSSARSVPEVTEKSA